MQQKRSRKARAAVRKNLKRKSPIKFSEQKKVIDYLNRIEFEKKIERSFAKGNLKGKTNIL